MQEECSESDREQRKSFLKAIDKDKAETIMKTRRKADREGMLQITKINNHTELIIKTPKNQKQERLLAFLGKRSKHAKGSKDRC